MKRIAILQSNYIPWRGYFDLIAAVDEFILLDEVQYTKNDWRNRNRIKTPRGAEWLSVPVGQSIGRRIRDVEIRDRRWQEKHWRALECNYRRAPFFGEAASLLSPLYLQGRHVRLSELNRAFLEAVCGYLGISTKITDSSEYPHSPGRTERILDLCSRSGAAEYLSGPAGMNYLREEDFGERGIAVRWFDYSGYPPYPQLWGDFIPGVTVLDLLFNCGPHSRRYMKFSGA